MIDIVITGIQQGLILAIITYAIMLPFRVLNFPDLSSEGSFTLGATALGSLLNAGFGNVTAILIACLVSGIAGIATATISLRLKVNSLLSGIIVSTMLYSANLRVLGRPNIAMQNGILDGFNQVSIILILLCVVLCIIIALHIFFRTRYGLGARAVGHNPSFAASHGISVCVHTVMGLFSASFLAGLSGCIMAETQGYVDIGMGIGIAIHALAALMIGERLSDCIFYRKNHILSPLFGALLYQQIQGVAMSLGLAPSDLKFFTGAMLLSIIAINNMPGKLKLSRKTGIFIE